MRDAFTIRVTNTGEEFSCSSSQNLLKGMEQLGRRCIPVGCRGGGCGICKVQVLEGRYHARKMSREHVSIEDEKNGIGLACRLFPDTDLVVEAIGKLHRLITRN